VDYSTTDPSNTALAIGFWARASSGYGTSAYAAVDRIIEIDPGFAQASEYTMIMSADTSVPEPASLVLAGGGIVGTLAMRRLKAVATGILGLN
jgi:hypothetical protein